jgi:hypothetical protein
MNATLLAARLLNSTVELAVNPMPFIVTTLLGGPLAGVNRVIERVTLNLEVVAAVPGAVVIVIVDEAAPFGTIDTILPDETTLNSAERVPNLTEFAPLRSEPVIVTELPVIPEVGLKDLMVGARCGITL